jgi:hypothetical protein
MTSAALDRLLAILVVAIAATGLATLGAGHPSGAWLFVIHGVLAGSLAGAIAIKLRRSLPGAVRTRRWPRLVLALVVSAAAAAALSGGWLWVTTPEIVWLDAGVFGRWTLLTLHAWIGLALVPLVIVHLVPRRWRLLRPGAGTAARAGGRRLSRRSALLGGGFALAGLAAFGVASAAERVLGGERRFTGSRLLPAAGIPPVTTFFGEPAPAIDTATWRLAVAGSVDRPGSYSLADLRTFRAGDLVAILDCTSGWAMETVWRGVTLGSLLDRCGAGDAREVRVISATGWSTALPIAEARGCLLAWEVAGQPLPVGNGAPLRLVAPDRRGLDWVKWVTALEVR